MDIFHFFSKKKKQPTLVRCTHCQYEFHLSPREVRLLCTQNAGDPVCPVKEECDICHSNRLNSLNGLNGLVNYTDEHGNCYIYNKIKPKIKNLDPNTVMERIFGGHFH